MTAPFASQFPLKEIEIDGILVSYEDSSDLLLSYFSKKEAKEFIELLHESQIDPKKTYPKALSWKEKHPKNPHVDNLLTFLHLAHKEKVKAEQLIKSSYLNHPDYFFSKINYADQCLRKKKLKEIALIFPSFDLKELFPLKRRYHVSEFRGFMILACRYHLLLKKKQIAKNFYEKAYLADPSHPNLVFLEKELFVSKSFSYAKSLILFSKFFKLCYDPLRKLGQKRSKTTS